MRETAWLVEWPQSFDGAGQWPPRWWHCVNGWMLDAGKATRFCRREDAEGFVAGSNMKWALVTEHAWIDGVCRECNGTGERTDAEGGPQYECRECSNVI